MLGTATKMNRRDFLNMIAVGSAPLLIGLPAEAGVSFTIEEATITELQAAMKAGGQTSASLVHWYLKRIEKIDLRGFGTFSVRDSQARTGRNPQTGDPLQIPARRVPSFKAGKELKERCNEAAKVG